MRTSVLVEQIRANLDQVMQQTFETYFFQEIYPEAEITATEASTCMEVDLAFKGLVSGHLHFTLSRRTAAELAGSMPMQTDLDDEAISDVFAEIANTVAGRIAAALALDAYAFDLTIPQVAFGRLSPAAKNLERSFTTDFGPLTVSISQLNEQARKGA